MFFTKSHSCFNADGNFIYCNSNLTSCLMTHRVGLIQQYFAFSFRYPIYCWFTGGKPEKNPQELTRLIRLFNLLVVLLEVTLSMRLLVYVRSWQRTVLCLFVFNMSTIQSCIFTYVCIHARLPIRCYIQCRKLYRSTDSWSFCSQISAVWLVRPTPLFCLYLTEIAQLTILVSMEMHISHSVLPRQCTAHTAVKELRQKSFRDGEVKRKAVQRRLPLLKLVLKKIFSAIIMWYILKYASFLHSSSVYSCLTCLNERVNYCRKFSIK